jgi:hypothetical protein
LQTWRGIARFFAQIQALQMFADQTCDKLQILAVPPRMFPVTALRRCRDVP